MPERVVLKIALDGAPAGRLRREHEVLTALQDPLAAGAAYFSQRLQQPVALGADTLALRVPSGFWGSLDLVQANYPDGVDARHVVWMWRRILEVLAYAHAAGWSHGRLHPGHLLVQPRDHGILIIGWAGATAAGAASCARDLRQAAWSMRAMLAPPRDANPPGMPAAVPAPLASLLRRQRRRRLVPRHRRRAARRTVAGRRRRSVRRAPLHGFFTRPGNLGRIAPDRAGAATSQPPSRTTMGHGNYSHAAHAAIIADRSASGTEVFAQRGCHPMMHPHGLTMRESRDSADHPHSLGIVFALDVTGSMGDIPQLLATRELPTFMNLLTHCGVTDPQLMFMAIGDATSDQAPLQVGQFESTAELMDQWLTWSYLEGGGGGTGEESYELAFYMVARHTDLDCWVKRRKKGYLFITGDEHPYPAVSHHQIGTLLGERLDADIPIAEAIAAAAETYHLFFLIPDLKRRVRCEHTWRKLLGDHVICMEDAADTCAVAAAIVALTERAVPDLEALAVSFKANGMAPARLSAVMRAIRSYAALLDPAGGGKLASGGGGGGHGPAAWFKRLFE